MSIQTEERIFYHGRPGRIITSVTLISRDELMHKNASVASNAMSFGQSLRTGQTEARVHNPFKNEEVRISYQTLADASAGVDLDNSFLHVDFTFLPDPGGPPLYPSVLADEMRNRGWSEEELQELLEWEQTVRANPPQQDSE